MSNAIREIKKNQTHRERTVKQKKREPVYRKSNLGWHYTSSLD